MTKTKDLLIITASNGANLQLASRFFKLAEGNGITSEILDLTQINLPLFNPRTQNSKDINSVLNDLNTTMKETPRWIICAPEYNGSIPPLLSNAIAWLSVQDNDFRSLFNGRPIAIASHSGGGCMELLLSLRIQLTHLGAQVVGRQLSSNNNKLASDEAIQDLINRIMQMQPLKMNKK